MLCMEKDYVHYGNIGSSRNWCDVDEEVCSGCFMLLFVSDQLSLICHKTATNIRRLFC